MLVCGGSSRNAPINIVVIVISGAVDFEPWDVNDMDAGPTTAQYLETAELETVIHMSKHSSPYNELNGNTGVEAVMCDPTKEWCRCLG